MSEKKNLMQTLVDDAFVAIFKKYETKVEMIDECADANLNHFWNRNKFLDFWDLGNMPFNQHYHEEKHGNGKFLLADNLKIESGENRYAKHGTYQGQPKVKDLGNDIVTDFFLLQPSQDLDLTWLKPQDSFRLHDGIQYRNLKNIFVNVDNLLKSSLNLYSPQYETDVDVSLNLVINNQRRSSKLGPKEQILAIRTFFEFQDENAGDYRVKHVTLDGFSQTMVSVIGSYLAEKGVSVSRRKQMTLNSKSKALKSEKATDDLGTEPDRL